MGLVAALMRACLGRIINVASRAVVPVAGRLTADSVANAGVIALTQAPAAEARPHGTCVNAVAPSTMDTPANRAAMPGADYSEWVKADVIVLLAGDAARRVTGALITV